MKVLTGATYAVGLFLLTIFLITAFIILFSFSGYSSVDKFDTLLQDSTILVNTAIQK